MNSKYKYLLEKIPTILASEDDLNKNFEKIVAEYKTVVEFENAYICYLNSGCANIQYKACYSDIQPVNEQEMIINFPEVLKNKLYDTNATILFDENSGFFKALNLNLTNSSYLLIKLNIRETVFGFMLVSRPKEMPFVEDEIEISKAFSSLISYSIKDSELSSVFKLQLRALQDSIFGQN